jgi:hypothetical protein
MSTSISNVNLHIFTLFILLIIFANNAKISANSIHHRNDYLSQSLIPNDDDQSSILFERDHLFSEPINDEISSPIFWPRTHRSIHSPTIPNFDFRSGVIRFIPYKKRTIPLELQKALYAHGIVGRRR